ncbi:MAG TPA: prolyl oligopeptidase family serine peptidase [Candidatus Dormibacteraeota bacterium]|jgi:dipeptidyl aminopeptidase/acylaminoacyl peptidase
MAATTVSPDLYLTVSRAYLPVPRPDGGLYFASDLAGHSQVYSLDQPGAWPVRRAASSDRVLPVASTEHGLLVREDQGGNETWQLSLMSQDGHSLRRLTTDAKAIHLAPTVSPDGRRVGLSYNPGGQVDFALASLDLETGKLEDWLRPEGMWRWISWSPEGGAAAVQRLLSPTRSEGYLLQRDGALTHVLPTARRVDEITWTRGQRLLAVSDLASEFLRLVEIDVGDPARPVRIVFDAGDADVYGYVPDPGGRRAALAINRGLYDELAIIDIASGEVEERLPLPDGIAFVDNVTDVESQLAWSPDGERLFVAWETPTTPGEIYELPGAGATRWTFAGGAGLPDARRPRAATYRSFDGLRIPAVHYRVDDAPRPTVVLFHGGPEGQARGNFNQTAQLLLAGGFDVLMPNVRGSTGYGIEFFSLDDKELRWDSVRDGCEAARYLKREGMATRTAAFGGSYGGFMTLAVLVEDPELWDAAVDIVGIADWHTFFKNTSGWRRALRAVEYGDPDIPAEAEFLAEFSPLRRAHAIQAPLLVLHGRNDVRVPVGEAEQIARATNAELMIFDDEGHGIVRHGNRVRAYGRALRFLQEKLG